MLIKFAADNNWEMFPTPLQKKKKEKKNENKKEITYVIEENKRRE